MAMLYLQQVQRECQNCVCVICLFAVCLPLKPVPSLLLSFLRQAHPLSSRGNNMCVV